MSRISAGRPDQFESGSSRGWPASTYSGGMLLLGTVPTYRSQFQQDRLLDSIVFRGLRKGVFVDIGAFDGRTISNTAVFEIDYGWTGLCIEPNPAVFSDLVANRHGSQCFNVAVGLAVGTLPFTVVGGAAGVMLSRLSDGTPPHHHDRIKSEIRRHGGSTQTITVPVKRGSDLMSGLREVHYLSIDTEGTEADVLRSIDFDKTMVHAITVECNERVEELLSILGDGRFVNCGRHRPDLFLINAESPFVTHAPELAEAIRIRGRGVGALVQRVIRGLPLKGTAVP